MIIRKDYLDPSGDAERVLVVVFLRGGADGLTLAPPVRDDLYRRSRPTLAVAPSSAIALDDTFSLHADLRQLMRHYESGEMGIVHGAGSEDQTRSHFEAQDFMEHGGDAGAGWLARFLRARSVTSSPLCAVAIGTTLPESLRGAPGGAVIETIRDFSIGGDGDEEPFARSLESLYASETDDLGRMARDTLEAMRRLRAIRGDDVAPGGRAPYPDTSFGRGLREVARLIRADVGLVASTIDLGGWDTHFGQDALIGALMRELAQGLDAFITDLGDERRRVMIVTMTEFGRRLGENTSLGTDHGLASVMFTIGAGLEGGRVYSAWRTISEAMLDDAGDPRVAINYRDVLAPVLRAHSPEIDLGRVFPGHAFGDWTGRLR
jgi:uncharacterized protein (DUF1501 family)